MRNYGKLFKGEFMKNVILVLGMLLSIEAAAEQIVLLPTKNLGQGLPRNGKVNMVIEYPQKCNQDYLGIFTRSQNNGDGTLEVRLIARENGRICKTATFPMKVVLWVDLGTQVNLIQPD
jgi:hypothetical protein